MNRSPSFEVQLLPAAALACALLAALPAAADEDYPAGERLRPGTRLHDKTQLLEDGSWFGRRHGFEGAPGQRIRIEFETPADGYFDELLIVDEEGNELAYDTDGEKGDDLIEFFVPHQGTFWLDLESEDEVSYVVALTVLDTPKPVPLAVGKPVKVSLAERSPRLLALDVPPALHGKRLRFEVTGQRVSARLQRNPNGDVHDCVVGSCRGTDFTWPDASASAYVWVRADAAGDATVLVTESDPMAAYFVGAKAITPGLKVADAFAKPAGAPGTSPRKTFFFQVAEKEDFALRVTSTGAPPRVELMESKEDAKAVLLDAGQLDGATRLRVTPGTWLVFVEPGAAATPGATFNLELVARPRPSDLLPTFGGPSETPVGPRVGMLDYARLFKEASEAKAAQAKLQTVFATYQELLDEKRKAMESLTGEALAKAQKEAQAFYEDLQAKLTEKERVAVEALGDRMLSLAPAFKKAHGVALLVDAELVVWAAPAADFTEALLRALDKGSVTPPPRAFAGGRVGVVDASAVFESSLPAMGVNKRLAAIKDTKAREKAVEEETKQLVATCERLVAPLAASKKLSIVLWTKSAGNPLDGLAWKSAPLDVTDELVALLNKGTP